MQKNGRLIIITIMLLETLLIVLINQQIFLSRDVDELKAFLPYINLIVLMFSGLIIYSIKGLEENVKKLMETSLLKTHLQQVEGLLNTLRTQEHEHNRHIQAIQAMLDLGEIDKAVEYIDGIAESRRHTETEKIVNVGHPVLTALLNSKRKIAESKKIDFAFAVKCDIASIDVHSWDLCSIVGNLLDNAFEAVLQDHIQRRVALEIKYEKANYVLYVYNTGPKISEKEKRRLFNRGYTTKESVARGYGLYLVKELVDRYGGKIDVISGERTTFIVYLPDRGRSNDDKSTCSENCGNYGNTATG